MSSPSSPPSTPIPEENPPSPEREQELVAAANRGERAAFEELYRTHRAFVLRVATRFTSSHADALDVLQETFLHLWSRFPGFELTGRLTSFLYPVALNAARSGGRRARRATTGEDALSEAEAPPAREDGESAREELSTVLAALPEAQREVLLLRFVEDLELSQIADALAIPLGTVKSRLHQALARLREDPRTRQYYDR